jgi:hypothetical protein
MPAKKIPFLVEGKGTNYLVFWWLPECLVDAFPSCESDQAAKACRLPDGHVGQHFPVYIDTGFFQPVHELTVSHSLGTAGGVNAQNPESPEIAFTLAPVEIGVAQRMQHGFVGALNQPVPGAPLALGQGKDFLMFLV